jgi:hypothetical protein
MLMVYKARVPDADELQVYTAGLWLYLSAQKGETLLLRCMWSKAG